MVPVTWLAGESTASMSRARRLELGTVSAEPLSRAYWSQKLRPLGETVGLSRARTSGESPDSAQAGRGPQWPIHRISAPANDAVRLPGARRLERQMTVTDGRAGHFRTVSAVVRVRPGKRQRRLPGSTLT